MTHAFSEARNTEIKGQNLREIKSHGKKNTSVLKCKVAKAHEGFSI
jgi:hypothetical protein